MEEDKITNEESLAVGRKKQKDPKKVAAGKALAIKNAEARKNSKAPKKEKEEPSLSLNDIYENIQKVAGLVGAGFTLYYGWKFFYPEQNVWAATTAPGVAPTTRSRDEAKKDEQPQEPNTKSNKGRHDSLMGCMD